MRNAIETVRRPRMARACASSFFVGDSSAGARPGTSAARAPDGAEGAAEYPARSTASQMSSSERAASEGRLVEGDPHAARQQVDGDVRHAVEPADRLLDVRLARSAGHAAHVECTLSHVQLLSWHY